MKVKPGPGEGSANDLAGPIVTMGRIAGIVFNNNEGCITSL
ncbi:MAG: hypothetical protein ACYDHY_12755 [Acidiferrobacterales bacterium]